MSTGTTGTHALALGMERTLNLSGADGNQPQPQEVGQGLTVPTELTPEQWKLLHLEGQKDGLGVYNTMEQLQQAQEANAAPTVGSQQQLNAMVWGEPTESRTPTNLLDKHTERMWGVQDTSNEVIGLGSFGDHNDYHLHTTSTPQQQFAALDARAKSFETTAKLTPQVAAIEQNIKIAQRVGNLEALLSAVPTLAYFQNTGQSVTGMVEDVGHLASEIHPHAVYGKAGENVASFREVRAAEQEAAAQHLPALSSNG